MAAIHLSENLTGDIRSPVGAAIDGTYHLATQSAMIQLREKNVDDRTLLERACEVRRLTREAGVLFILNDRADLARLCDADGVHCVPDPAALPDVTGVWYTKHVFSIRQSIPLVVRDVFTGIRFIDLTAALRREADAGRLTYNPIADTHLNRLGSLTVGEALADALGPVVAAPPR